MAPIATDIGDRVQDLEKQGLTHARFQGEVGVELRMLKERLQEVEERTLGAIEKVGDSLTGQITTLATDLGTSVKAQKDRHEELEKRVKKLEDGKEEARENQAEAKDRRETLTKLLIALLGVVGGGFGLRLLEALLTKLGG